MLGKHKYIAFNKPYGVLCQFTAEEGDSCLNEFNLPKDVYAAGRLDKDSEGLLLLTSDGSLINKITSPQLNKIKIYLVQVEKFPSETSLDELASGVFIKGKITKQCIVNLIGEPEVPERIPPVRFRKTVPTCWLEIHLSEGRNRQIRKMTAAIGHPTLRIIRTSINKLHLEDLKPGEFREVNLKDII
jgi:23S rRNA pseudouridine2457 synthase